MSQVKVTTLMTSDGAKQATSTDVIDGATKTKLFSPFSLAMLAGVDDTAHRSSISAAKSGSNSDITQLTGLTTPLSTAQGGIGGAQGFIEGLTLTWVSVTSVTVGAGSAYVQSVNKVVSYAGGTITPSGAANSFIHLYLTSAGAIEQSTTAPVRYYNQAFAKTGDTSRRYIASMLVNATVNQVYKFHHHPIQSLMMYTHANPSVAPFRVLNGVTGVGSFSLTGCIPVTGHSMVGTFQTTGTGVAQFTPSDAGTSVATGWEVFVSQAIVANATCRVADDGTISYFTSNTNTAFAYVSGYYFDR